MIYEHYEYRRSNMGFQVFFVISQHENKYRTELSILIDPKYYGVTNIMCRGPSNENSLPNYLKLTENYVMQVSV